MMFELVRRAIPNAAPYSQPTRIEQPVRMTIALTACGKDLAESDRITTTSNIVLSESSRLNSPPYDHPHNVWQWMTHHNATNAARIKDAFGGEVAKRLLHLKGALFCKQQVSLDLNTVPQAS